MRGRPRACENAWLKSIALLLLLLVVGGLLAWVGLTASEPEYVPPRPGDRVPIVLESEVPAGYVVRDIDVEGMCCDGCRGKLYGAVTALEGVQAAAIDHVAGMAQVVVPADADLAPVLAALTFDQYVATQR